MTAQDIKTSHVLLTDLPISRDFNYWSDRFEKRQQQFLETETKKGNVIIEFDEEPIINCIADPHLGAEYTDYNRFNEEIRIILKTPNSYLMAFGDWVDGMFFNPGQMEQIEQVPEQYQYAKSVFEKLSKEGKLLVAFAGDHDGWPKKMGVDPYQKFSEDYKAYYMQGVGYITIKVGNIEYKMIAAHRLPGFSQYNNAHAEMRLGREVQGGDIYLAAHTHSKGYVQQEVSEFGGKSRICNYISLGPYKSEDDFSRKKGFVPKTKDGMYGCCFKLYKDHKQVKYYSSILEGNDKRNTRIEKGWVV